MLERVGILACSFGLCEREPSPQNQSLAGDVMAVSRSILADGPCEVFIAAQWEIALGLDRYDLAIGPELDSYLDTDELVDTARRELFEPNGVTRVVPVANPFLHLPAVRAKLKAAGLEPVSRHVTPLRNNPDSLQPWTRSRPALVAYAVRQKLTGHQGQPTPTAQMRAIAAGGGLPPNKP